MKNCRTVRKQVHDVGNGERIKGENRDFVLHGNPRDDLVVVPGLGGLTSERSSLRFAFSLPSALTAAAALNGDYFGITSGRVRDQRAPLGPDTAFLAVVDIILPTLTADDDIRHAVFRGVDLEGATFHVSVEREAERGRGIDTKADLTVVVAVGNRRFGRLADASLPVRIRRNTCCTLLGDLVDLFAQGLLGSANTLLVCFDVIHDLGSLISAERCICSSA